MIIIEKDKTRIDELADELDCGFLRGDVRFFVIALGEDDAGPLSGLSLPDETRVLYGYRDGEPLWPEEDLRLEAGDDLVLLTTSRHLQELKGRGRSRHD